MYLNGGTLPFQIFIDVYGETGITRASPDGGGRRPVKSLTGELFSREVP